MLKRVLPLLFLILLAGCGGPSYDTREHKPVSNLEPEITELDALKNSRGRPLTPAERHALESKAGIAFRLTPEETEEVKLFFQYFTREKHDTVQRWMLRSEPHLEYVRAVLTSQRLPQDLLALPYIESGYNVMAVSGSGAAGMWQFMPATARRFGLTVDWWLDERRDPYLATVAAARYLKALHAQFGDWQLALAAYNAGEGSISRAMASTGTQSFKTLAKSSAPLKDETKHYVPKFLAMLKIAKNAKRLGFDAPNMQACKDLEEVRIPGGTDLAGLAAHLGFNWDQFHALNPAYRRQVSPPDRTTAAWVPKRLAPQALAFLNHPQPGNGSPVRLARSGETWWSLSRETGIPANILCDANKGQNAPTPGQALLIPVAACSLDAGVPYDAPGKPGKQGPAYAQAKGHPVARFFNVAPARTPAQEMTPASAQPTLYIVRRGDTLESVASKTGVGVQELISFNKANPREGLTPGTPLLIPAKGQPAQAAQAQPQPARATAYQYQPPVREAQVEQPAPDKTELNPAPKYRIIRRSGT